MKHEPQILINKSLDSLLIAIEHFNRPWDLGRNETVLILLDRSFELLLKAAIIHKGGKIREKRAKETLGFDKCVRKCLSEEKVKCLTNEQAVTIQIINSLRDAAQHYLLDVSEEQLYLYTQAGVTLYAHLLQSIFEIRFKDRFPSRVLPISSSPPKDFWKVIEMEFQDIQKLVAPGARKRIQASARLRTLAIVEDSLSGSRSQPGEPEIMKLVREIQKGKRWQDLFPGIASLNLDTKGTGLSVSIRLTKKDGEPVHLVPEGTPGATVVAIKRVEELGFYSMGLIDLAAKLRLSSNMTLAVVRALKIQNTPEFFKVIKIGKSSFKRYSTTCLDHLKSQLPNLDMSKIWGQYGPAMRKKNILK